MNLPPGLLETALGFLEVGDLCRARSVCSQWKNLRGFWEELVLPKNEASPKLNMCSLKHVQILTMISNVTFPLENLTTMTNLVKLDMSWCTRLRDCDLALIQAPQLRVLIVRCCNLITNDGLACLSSLTNLERLNLSCCEKVTDAGLVHIAGLKTLVELDVSGIKGVTNKGLQHLAALTDFSLATVWCTWHGWGSSGS